VWESIAFIEGSTLRSALQEELGFPIRMDNDGRAAAMGEAFIGGHVLLGVGRPTSGMGMSRRLLSLTLGTGVGVAMVVDGRLLEKNSISHLAGHIPIRPGVVRVSVDSPAAWNRWLAARVGAELHLSQSE
jgi:glucokinase